MGFLSDLFNPHSLQAWGGSASRAHLMNKAEEQRQRELAEEQAYRQQQEARRMNEFLANYDQRARQAQDVQNRFMIGQGADPSLFPEDSPWRTMAEDTEARRLQKMKGDAADDYWEDLKRNQEFYDKLLTTGQFSSDQLKEIEPLLMELRLLPEKYYNLYDIRQQEKKTQGTKDKRREELDELLKTSRGLDIQKKEKELKGTDPIKQSVKNRFRSRLQSYLENHPDTMTKMAVGAINLSENPDFFNYSLKFIPALREMYDADPELLRYAEQVEADAKKFDPFKQHGGSIQNPGQATELKTESPIQEIVKIAKEKTSDPYEGWEFAGIGKAGSKWEGRRIYKTPDGTYRVKPEEAETSPETSPAGDMSGFQIDFGRGQGLQTPPVPDEGLAEILAIIRMMTENR